VLKDLPPKVERMIPIGLTTLQKKLYKAILQRNSSILRHIGAQINNAQPTSTPLHNILMELRKLCGHPYLLNDVEPTDLDEDAGRKAYIEASGKLQLLAKLLPKLKARGHRVLIFSQFKLVLDILEDFLIMEKHTHCRLVWIAHLYSFSRMETRLLFRELI
jgi:chromodomain-helicase-DNA-binding protein 4